MDRELVKWCDLERCTGRVYPAGTVYIKLSASDNIARQLREPQSLSDRFVAFIPKKFPNVFFEIFADYWIGFYARFNQGINFAFSNLKFIRFPVVSVSDKELSVMESVLIQVNKEIELTENQIKRTQDIKNYYLDKMFCK
mgnify:CR=1 FL=1